MSLGYEISKEILQENFIEIINEESHYSDNNIGIFVDTTKNGSYGYRSSYFKYYFKRHSKWYIARLLLCTAEFTTVEHSNNKDTTRGKYHNIKNATHLTSGESEVLMGILRSSCTDVRYTSIGATTIYSAMIINANLAANVSLENIEKYKNTDPEKCPRPILPYNCPVPNYSKII